MHANELGNMLISNNSYHDVKVTEYRNMKRVYELNTCIKAAIKRTKLYFNVFTHSNKHSRVSNKWCRLVKAEALQPRSVLFTTLLSSVRFFGRRFTARWSDFAVASLRPPKQTFVHIVQWTKMTQFVLSCLVWLASPSTYRWRVWLHSNPLVAPIVECT